MTSPKASLSESTLALFKKTNTKGEQDKELSTASPSFTVFCTFHFLARTWKFYSCGMVHIVLNDSLNNFSENCSKKQHLLMGFFLIPDKDI